MKDQDQSPQPYTECPECGGKLRIYPKEIGFELDGSIGDWGDDAYSFWCLGCDAFADGQEPECWDETRGYATIAHAFAGMEPTQ